MAAGDIPCQARCFTERPGAGSIAGGARLPGVRGAAFSAPAWPASPCDPALTKLLEQAVAAQGIAPRRLVSGAGHDAMVMAALCPTAMLFVRCDGGISHNPAERASAADAGVAVAAMLDFIERLGATRGN